MIFHVAVLLVGVVAGGVASIAGFGIGSLLTPVLGLRLGMKLAVAAVSIPHAIGTAWRLWSLRTAVDRRVLLGFGTTSAAGGLVGALLHAYAGGFALTLVFGALLVFAGTTGLTGWSDRMRFGRKTAWLAGALSGLLGGMVGNQGGVRSAALLGFRVGRDAFVATATAIALIVDAARVPVYLWNQGGELRSQWMLILLAAAGVLTGTIAGYKALRRIPEAVFRKVVSGIVLALGLYMLYRAWAMNAE